jgi:hypothetical protein
MDSLTIAGLEYMAITTSSAFYKSHSSNNNYLPSNTTENTLTITYFSSLTHWPYPILAPLWTQVSRAISRFHIRGIGLSESRSAKLSTSSPFKNYRGVTDTPFFIYLRRSLAIKRDRR